ncbi:MAG: helix-hairpin-helix domain-containing protein [Bacteroidetes bacterium]|nr:helix-hairpin-helix domain-containing protein [Bacteroidota bacterium]
MKRQKRGVYLYMAEYRGAVILLLLALVLAVLPRVFGVLKPYSGLRFLADSASLAELTLRHKAVQDSFFSQRRRQKVNLHFATADELLEKGLSKEQSEKLLSAFRQKRKLSLGELSRISGIDTQTLTRFVSPKSFRYPEKNAKTEVAGPVDVNTADSTELIRLPGIGSKTANRILNWRDKLGGFTSFNQIKETWYVDTVVLNNLKDRFIINPAAIRRLQVNVADETGLDLHPYISKTQAKAIVAWRKQHGNISAQSFATLLVFSPAERARLLPYLQFD